jgi:radical SAM protein with 4Fe4S-binding SPASM domain
MLHPSAPLSYAVEITFACNNFCSGCANVWEPRRNEILHNWKELFDKIAPPENRRKYAQLLRITGGEPTLHKEFHQIIEYIDTFDIAHAVFTTGRWGEPHKIVELYLQCRNFIGMLISLHGSTKFAHNTFVESVDWAFDETCNNIRLAASAGLEVFTNTVLTKYSCKQVEEIVRLSQDLGASYALFNRFLGSGHPLEPAKKQLREAIILIEKFHAEGVPCRIGNCVPMCFVENTSDGGNGGFEHCAISPKGWVRPDNLTSYVFGNIFEQSIETIWQSERAQWYRRQIPQACLECVELARCRGGAKSVGIEHGFKKDPLMKEPIREAKSETLVFDPDWKPVPCFSVREEPFGYLVARYNWSIPVTHDAKPILEALNGENTLADLEAKFGDGALEFIGQLYEEKCIDFE